MIPTRTDRSEYQGEIAALLKSCLPDWSILVECAIATREGTKVPDVAAMTRARRLPHRGAAGLPVAPEICVEVKSWSNSSEELVEKRRLYSELGCQEFWACSEKGEMAFQDANSGQSLERSVLCPDFPGRVEI